MIKTGMNILLFFFSAEFAEELVAAASCLGFSSEAFGLVESLVLEAPEPLDLALLLSTAAELPAPESPDD